MKSIFPVTSFLVSALTLLIILNTGCNDKITQVPVIESINVTPDTVVVGNTAMIQLSVTDADDQNLVYYYTTTGGAISGIGDTVEWQAPDEPGIYFAHVLVADKDGNQANDSVRLVVLKNDSSTRITGVAAFAAGTNLNLLDSKIRLYTSKENLDNHVAFAEVQTEGFGPIVSFRFDNIPIGTYYLTAWTDTDFGNTMNAGDYYGWFGRGNMQLPEPDPFTIEAGTTKVLQVQMWVVPVK